MATAGVAEYNEINEANLCSICLEQYKLPVVLLCSHSFCQICLEAHIKSSCVELDPPLGFPCPLCRVFIPAPGRIGQYSLDDWATKFPKNKLLESVLNESSLFCKPCLEDEEKVSANGWCQDCLEALCDACVKYHKKCRPSRHHFVVSLNNQSFFTKEHFSLEVCEAHSGRKFEIFCKKHFQPCCVVCVTEDHASCNALCQLEGIDGGLVAPEMEEGLQNDVEKFRLTVEQTIQEEKENMDSIDNVSDEFTKELSELTATIIQVVKRLEEKHLDHFAKLSKEYKSKLQHSIKSFDQRLQYLFHWKEVLLKTTSEKSQANRVLSYSKMKNVLEGLKELSYSKLEIGIQTKCSENVRMLQNVACLAEIAFSEHMKRVELNLLEEFDVATAKVKTICALKLKTSDIKGGEFLKHDSILLADYSGKKIIVYDTNGVFLREKSLPGEPWGVCTSGENEVFVTLPIKETVLRLDSDSLDIKESVSLTCRCYGIATSGNKTVIGQCKSLVMFQGGLDNTKCTPLSNNLSGIDEVAFDDEYNVIYSSHTNHSVRKQDKLGSILFTYTHKQLKNPCRLAVSRNGYIFVNGFNSHNIHILSKNGELLRILDGVKNPTWIKFRDDTNRLYVVESNTLKVFEFTTSEK